MNSCTLLELSLIFLAIFLATCHSQVQLWRFGIFKDFNPPQIGKFNQFCYLLGDWKDNHGNNVSITRGYMRGVFNVNLRSKGIIYKGGFLSRQYDVSEFSSAVQPVHDKNRTLLMIVSCATIDKKDHAYVTLIPEANCPQQTPAFHDFARIIIKCNKPIMVLQNDGNILNMQNMQIMQRQQDMQNMQNIQLMQRQQDSQKLVSPETSRNNLLNSANFNPPGLKLRATYSTEDFQLPKGSLNKLQDAQRQRYTQDTGLVQKIKNIFSSDTKKQHAQHDKSILHDQPITTENFTQFHLQLSAQPIVEQSSQQQYFTTQQLQQQQQQLQQQQLLQKQKAQQQAQLQDLQKQYQQQLQLQDQQAQEQILFQQQEIF